MFTKVQSSPKRISNKPNIFYKPSNFFFNLFNDKGTG